MRVVDKDALVQIKIPYPLPLSWGRTVQPYVPTAVNESEAERDASIHANEAQPCNRAPQQSSVLSTEWSAIRNDFLVIFLACSEKAWQGTASLVSVQVAKSLLPYIECASGLLRAMGARHVTCIAIGESSLLGKSFPPSKCMPRLKACTSCRVC